MADLTAHEKALCFKCRYLRITWEPALPYGCNAMGFKSRSMPAVVVYENSGMACQAFMPKDAGNTRQKGAVRE